MLNSLAQDPSPTVRSNPLPTEVDPALLSLLHASPLAICGWDGSGHVSFWNEAAAALLGWTPDDIMGRPLPLEVSNGNGGCHGLFAQIGLSETPIDAEMRVKRRDGSWLDVRLAAKPVRDASGRCTGMLAECRDLSHHNRAERRQTVVHTLTRLLAELESEASADVLPKIMRTICESLDWQYGAYWGLDKQDQVLRCAQSWGATETIEFTMRRAHEAITIQTTQSPTLGGIIRRAWLTRGPIWVTDVCQDPTFRRAAFAKQLELHSSFAFPVLSGDAIVGVMEFFCHDVRESDELLMETANTLGIQVGQYIRRKQAEDRQAMEHAVTLLLAEAESPAQAMTQIIKTICDTLGWIYGAYWAADRTKDALSCVDLWHTPDIDMTEFVAAARSRTEPLTDGEPNTNDPGGVIRRACVSGEPIWIADVTRDSSFRRGAIAAKLGLHSAFAFPITMGRDLLGVMEFFGRDIRQPDEALLSSTRSISSQISQFCQRKQAEERIQYYAYYDGLTGLANRVQFNQRLSHALAAARRHGRQLAILFIDLDRFKTINDTLGHQVGDELLCQMARRLKSCLRESDTIARLGGDEFVVLIEEITDSKQVANVARKILGVAAEAFTIGGHEHHVTTSIGISLYPNDGEDELTLMKNSDIAMYLAKERGKNNYQFYEAQINVNSFERLAMESSLRRALERNEFLLHFQPKIDLRTGAVTGMEALLRWQHPELGMVPPANFIPLTEETGLIVPIGRWVIRAACAQNRAWIDRGLPRLRMAVNLSARQLMDEYLPRDVARILAETGLDADLLELEITESMVMYKPERMVKLLSDLKAMGVHIAIDDFGIGYSSLAQLKRFPIDTIKVDRSFIREVANNSEDAAISQAIIAMGKTLNLQVIAEGVETREQLQFLRAHDCDEMQGYYFSKPLPAAEFEALMRSNPALDAGS